MAQVSPLLSTQPLAAPGTILPVDSELVGVHVGESHRRLVAIKPIAKGTRIFHLDGRETVIPTRYSIQVGAKLHLDPDFLGDERESARRFFWRFLDHACEPNVRITDREVFAVRDIAAGDPVTFHYCTTEYDMAAPFDCLCGSKKCMRVVRGAKHLTAEQRKPLAKWMADYLR